MRTALVTLLFIAGSAIGNAAVAGCSSTYFGQSSTHSVGISDNACEHSQLVLSISMFDEEGVPKKGTEVRFSQECSLQDDGGIRCRKSGRTVLAGAVYAPTKDTNPKCPGERVGTRLTCVAGCKPEAPKYLYIEPYEC